MSIIDNLIFDNLGCCGTHSWATITHDNGKTSTVYDDGDDGYTIATHSAGILLTGSVKYPDKSEAETRLMCDAA